MNCLDTRPSPFLESHFRVLRTPLGVGREDREEVSEATGIFIDRVECNIPNPTLSSDHSLPVLITEPFPVTSLG